MSLVGGRERRRSDGDGSSSRNGRRHVRDRGSLAAEKDRDRLELGDLPAFGQPVTLVWVKRRWHGPARLCPQGSWTEQDTLIAAPRCALTRRAGLWATRQVGQQGRPISAVAEEVAMGWHAVQSALEVYGTRLVDDPARREVSG